MRDHHSILLLEKVNFPNLQGGRSSQACHVVNTILIFKKLEARVPYTFYVKRDGAISRKS